MAREQNPLLTDVKNWAEWNRLLDIYEKLCSDDQKKIIAGVNWETGEELGAREDRLKRGLLQVGIDIGMPITMMEDGAQEYADIMAAEALMQP